MTATSRVVHRDDAEALWVVRDRIRFMGELDGTELAVMEVEVPPGSRTPPHHHASPEIFRVLRGELTFGLLDGRTPACVVVHEGGVVTVASGAPHFYHNASDAPAAMLVVVERSMVAFFREAGRREAPPMAPPGDAEIAEVLAACARHGITILGGAPA